MTSRYGLSNNHYWRSPVPFALGRFLRGVYQGRAVCLDAGKSDDYEAYALPVDDTFRDMLR